VLHLSKVFIEENFFPLDIYNKIVQQLYSVEYNPPDKNKTEEHKGSYWHKHKLPNGCDVQKQMVKLIQEKFNFIISEFIESSYTMVGASDRPRPHTDLEIGATHQCLIYMAGEEQINSGTGFYHEKKTGEEQELSIHVGFKCNRAIFFTSNVFHCPLQWAGNGSFRYSISNFFN
jgi:hypothetical protein|tara:strand:- start:5341 stop:5862 length:522 start_codon:yes stop_codon:yes gene_type:complete